MQWLAAAAGGENGTVVGVIRVDFGYDRYGIPYYSPPRATTQLYRRRYYTSRDFLRQFTG